MKLHLPSGLRKALLACLAALSLPASGVATTIASASGIAAAFAALSAISASQARAAAQDESPADELPAVTLADEEDDEDDDSLDLLQIASGDALPAEISLDGGWPDESEFSPGSYTVNGGETVNQSGTVTYVGNFNNGTVTLQGGDSADSAISVKLTAAGTGEFAAGTLSLSGHIKDLMFTGGQFRYSGWTIAENTTIGDIYVKDAMLFLKSNTTLAADLHLGGRYNESAWAGALRINSQSKVNGAPVGCTVSLTGSLVIEEDTLISVQIGSVFKATGQVVTGTAGTSHNLLIGSYDGTGDPMGDAHVEFLGGGTLAGTLGFSSTGGNGRAPYLILGRGAAEAAKQTLTVYGLNSTAGGYIIAGEEGDGYAELVLNGTGTYTFDGGLGTNGSPQGSASDSHLNLTVRGANQALSGAVSLHDLTIADGGTLTVSNGDVTVNGDFTLTGNCHFNVTNGSLTVKGQSDVWDYGWRVGSVTVSETATFKSGLKSTYYNAHVNAKNLVSEVGEEKSVNFEGFLNITEKLTKKGAGTQTLYGPELLIAAIDVEAGTLHFGGSDMGNGSHASSFSTGAINVSDSAILEWKAGNLTTTGVMTLGTGSRFDISHGTVALNGALSGGDRSTVSVTGGAALTLNAASTLNGTMNVDGGSLTVNENLTIKNLTTGGSGLTSLTLAGGKMLEVQAGNLKINNTWSWAAGSKLKFGSAGQVITLGGSLSLPEQGTENKLTIDLSTAFLGSSGRVQLFGEGWQTGWKDYFQFTVNDRALAGGLYANLALGDDGYLTWTPTTIGPVEYTWTASGGSNKFTWSTDASEWDGKGTYTNAGTEIVSFVANEAAATVTLNGKSIEAGQLTLSGSQAITVTQTTVGYDSVTVGSDGMSVGTGVTWQAGLTVNGRLTLQAGATLAFNQSGQLHLGAQSSIELGANSTLSLAGDTLYWFQNAHTAESKLQVTGSGAFEVDLSNAVAGGNEFDAATVRFDNTIQLKLKGKTDASSTFKNLAANNVSILSGQDVVLGGENNINVLDASQMTGALTLGSEHTSTTITGTQEGTTTIRGALSIIDGTLTVSQGNLTIAGDYTQGDENDDPFRGGIVSAPEVTVARGDVTVSGNFNMYYDSTLTVTNGDLTVAGECVFKGMDIPGFDFAGAVNVENGKATFMQGLSCGEKVEGALESYGFHVNARDLESRVAQGKEVEFDGHLVITGTLTKSGEGKQTLYGTELKVGTGSGTGTIAVTGGTLHFGGVSMMNMQPEECYPDLATGTITVSDAAILEWAAGNLTATSVTLEGNMSITAGEFEWAGTGDKNLTVVDATTLSGTLTIDGGSNNTFTGALTATNGTLSVQAGQLTLTGGLSGTLSSLQLAAPVSGQPASSGRLNVEIGSFTISDSWGWGTGSVLHLGSAGQVITLGGDLHLNMQDNAQLTIDLSSDFLGGDKGGSGGGVKLFEGWNESWLSKFEFTVDGEAFGEGNYKDLRLKSDGTLSWGSEPGDLYWGGGQEHGDLTWGGSEGSSFNENEEGSGSEKWVDRSEVHFVAPEGTHNVSLAQNVTTASFTADGGEAQEPVQYNFASNDPETPRNLQIGGGLTATNVSLTFSEDVQLSVTGDVSLTSSTLSLGADMSFTGTITDGENSIRKAPAAEAAAAEYSLFAWSAIAASADGTVYTLWDNGQTASATWEDLTAHFGSSGELGEGVGYGVNMTAGDLTISDAATLTRNFKATGSGRTITFSAGLAIDGNTVEVAEGATLATSSLSGSGTVTGSGVLQLTGVSGGFTGTIETDLVYNGADGALTGNFSGSHLALQSGNLALGSGFSYTGSGATATVTAGILKLANDVDLGEVAIQLNGARTTELLHLDGSATIKALYGTGKVTIQDASLALTISGQAEESQVFGGDLCPGHVGRVNVTGRMYLGNGANLGNSVNVTGTLAMAASETPITAQVYDLHVGTNGNVQLGAKATLEVVHSWAGDSLTSLTLGSDSSLKFDADVNSGTITLGQITLNGDANLILLATGTEGNLLLDGLTSGEVQLVDWGAGYDAWKDSIVLDGSALLNYGNVQLTDTGMLTWSDAVKADFTWTDSQHEGSHAFTWSANAGDWDTEGTFNNDGTKSVAFVADGADVTITLDGGSAGDVEEERRNVPTIQASQLTLSGSHNITVSQMTDGGDSVTVGSGGMRVGTNVTWQADLTVGGELVIEAGKTMTVGKASDSNAYRLTQNGKLTLQDGATLTFNPRGQLWLGADSSVELGANSTLRLVGDTPYWFSNAHTAESKLQVTGSGTFEVDFSNAMVVSLDEGTTIGNEFDAAAIQFAETIQLNLKGKTDASSTFKNLTANNVSILSGQNAELQGTNTFGTLDSQLSGTLTLFNGHTSTTITGATVNVQQQLVVAAGTFSATNATVVLGGGLSSDVASESAPHKWGGTVNVRSLESTVSAGESLYEGRLTITEGLVKKGAGTQTLYGNSLSIGSIDVQGGILHLGGPSYSSNTAHRPSLNTGAITVSGEGSALEWRSGALTATGVTLGSGSRFDISYGTAALSGALSGAEGSSVSVTGGAALTLNAASTLNGAMTVNNGSLTVNENLTIKNLTTGGSGLTSLTLAGDKTLEVQSGAFTISTSWTWGEHSTLKLGSAGQVITLGSGLSLASESGTLTIDLSDAFLGDSGHVQLFSGLQEGWKERFHITVNGADPGEGYGDLTLGDDGYLTWTPVIEEGIVWGQTGEGGTATWSNGGAFSSDGNFTDGNSVTFQATDGVATHVVIDGAGVETKRMTVKSGTDWSFSGGALTITGTLALGGGDSAAGATFNDMQVSLNTLNGAGTVNITGTSSFEWAGLVVGDGETATKLNIDGAVTVGSAQIAAGNLSVKDNSAVTLNSSAAVYMGAVQVGSNGTFVLGGTGAVTTGGITVASGGVVELNRQLTGLSGCSVSGAGELKVNTGTALNDGNFNALVGGNLGTFTIADGTGVLIGSSSHHRVNHVSEYRVEAGGALTFNAPVVNYPEITVHIAGRGRQKGDGESGHEVETSSYAALGLYNYDGWTGAQNTTCTFKVVLDDDASLGVGNNNAGTAADFVQMQGSIDFAGHRLIKVGYGDLRLNGNFQAIGDSGAIDVENGKVTLAYTQNADTLRNIDINLCGSTVGETAVSGALQVNESATIGSLTGSGTVTLADGKVLTLSKTLTGSAFTGTISGAGTVKLTQGVSGSLTQLTLGGGVRMELDSGDLSLANAELTLNGDSSLLFAKLGNDGGQKLVLGANGLTEGSSGHLVLVLTDALLEGLTSGEVQLVDWGAGYDAWKDSIVLDGSALLNYGNVQLTDTGMLTWSDAVKADFTWTDSQHEGSHAFTWSANAGDWDTEGTFNNDGTKSVAFVAKDAEVTVTLNGEGAGTEAGDLPIKASQLTLSGSHKITVNQTTRGGGGDYLQVGDFSVKTDVDFAADMLLEGTLSIAGGKTFNMQYVDGGQALLMLSGANAGITLGNGATLDLTDARVRLRADAGGSTITLGDGASLIAYGTDANTDAVNGGDVNIEGTGTFVLDMSSAGQSATFDASARKLHFAQGVNVNVKTSTSTWNMLKNLEILGGLSILSGKEVVLQGTNTIGSLDGSQWTHAQAHVTFDAGNTSTTFQGDVTLGNAGMEVRQGVVTLEKGASLGYYTQQGGTLNAQDGAVFVAGNYTQSNGTTSVNSGGLSVTGNYSQSGGSTTVYAGGLSVEGAYSQSGGTTTVSAGGLSVTGDYTQGTEAGTGETSVTVTSGDVTLGGAFNLYNKSTLDLAGGNLTVEGRTIIGGYDFGYEADFEDVGDVGDMVTVSVGALTVSGEATFRHGLSGGADNLYGSSVSAAALNVEVSAEDGDGEDTDGDVTFLGNLDVTGQLSKSGAGRQTFYGKTLRVGAIEVTGGALHFGNSQDDFMKEEVRWPSFTTGAVTVSGEGAVLEWDAGALIATGDVTLGEGNALQISHGSVALEGALNAAQGSISMGNGAGLEFRSDTAAENVLGSLTLEASGTEESQNHELVFRCDEKGYTSVTLGDLSANDQTLTLTLSGLDDYADAHTREEAAGWYFDLFHLSGTEEGVGQTLRAMMEAGHLEMGDSLGYDWEFTSEGQLHVTRMAEVTWTASEHYTDMTWQEGGNDWDGSVIFETGYRVRFVGSGSEETITLGGNVQTGKLTTEGVGSFHFTADGEPADEEGNSTLFSITARAADFGTSASFGRDLHLLGKMRIQKNKTVTFSDGSLRLQDEGCVYLEEGATLDVTYSGLYHESGTRRHVIDGAGGTVEINFMFGDLNWMHFTEGVTLVVTGENLEVDSVLSGVEAEGLVRYKGRNLKLSGTNVIGSLEMEVSSYGSETPVYTLSLIDGQTTITGEEGLTLKNDYTQSAGNLTVTRGDFVVSGDFILENAGTSVNVEQGTIRLSNGVSSSAGHWSASLNGHGLELLNAEDKSYDGQVHISGDVSKKGAGEQHIYSGDAGVVFEVGGDVTVSAGTLKLGRTNTENADYSHSTGSIGGDVRVTGGTFNWDGAADLTIGGDVSVSGTGLFRMTRGSIGGSLTVDGEEARVEFAGETTLEGDLDVKGELSLAGEGVVLKTQGGLVGTLSLSDGARVEVGEGMTINTLKANNGVLKVKDNGSLTISQLEGEGLGLQLGDLSTLNAGGLTLGGELTWGSAALWNLLGTEKITLAAGFDSEAAGDGKLRVHLTQEFLDQYDKNNPQPFFNLEEGVVWNPDWASAFQLECDKPRTYSGLHIDRDTGNLVWEGLVGVEWLGGDRVWSAGDKPENWENVTDPQGGTTNPEGQDVHFTVQTSQGDVTIVGTVNPRNVYVDGGDHVFTGDGGINLTAGDLSGAVYVGGDGEDAKLTLDVRNVNLPSIRLEKQGSLVVSNKDAMTVKGKNGAKDTTRIKFMGGVLEYSGDKALESGFDLSTFVADLRDGSTDKARVNVSAEGAYAEGVKWGGENARLSDNGGLRLALDEKGIEKSGKGSLSLEWREVSAPVLPDVPPQAVVHTADISVTEGSLEYKVHTDGEVTLSGDADVRNSESNEASLLALTVAEGSGALHYAGKLTGNGSVELQANEGKIVMRGDSSAFEGQIGIVGGTISVVNDDALGGENTRLELKGGSLFGSRISDSDKEEMVSIKAGKVNVLEGNVILGDVKLSGSVSGSGTLTAADDSKVELSGDISKFSGSLDTGANGLWIQSAGGDVRVSLRGDGAVEFTGSNTIFNGDLEGGLTLQTSGDGALTVTSITDDRASGVKLNGNITLGRAASQAAVWHGTELLGGSITLANVQLRSGNEMSKQEGAKLYVNTAVDGAVDASELANGLQGELLDGITINQGGELIGVTGSYTVDAEHAMTLFFDGNNASNVRVNKEGASALITGINGFDLRVGALEPDIDGEEGEDNFLRSSRDSGMSPSQEGAGADLQVVFSAEVYGKLRSSTELDAAGNQLVWLHVLNGGTVGTPGMIDLSQMRDGVARQLARTCTLQLQEDGFLLLSGSTDNLYIVMNYPSSDEATIWQEGSLVGKDSVVVLDGLTLTLQMDGSSADRDNPIIHNLLGTKGATLNVTNAAEDKRAARVILTLDNTWFSTIEDNRPGNNTQVNGSTVQGEDTTFDGSIHAGEGVDVNKTGLGALTVTGNYTLDDGATTITQGALVLRGETNTMEGLNFAYTKKQDTAGRENLRGLVLDGGKTTINGAISDRDNTADGDDIVLKNNAKLELKGTSSLASASIIGEGNAAGTVTLKSGADGTGASLSFTGTGDANGDGKADERLSGVAVQMEEGTTLDIGKGSGRLTNLEGSGTLKSDGSGTAENRGTLTVSSGSFSGTLAASDSGTAGTLAVEAGKSFSLNNASSEATQTDPSAWKVKLGKGSNLKVDVSARPNYLVLGNVDLGDGNMTVDFGNRPLDGNSLEATIASVGSDGVLEFYSTKGVQNGTRRIETGIMLGEGVSESDFKDKHLKFYGVGNFLTDNKVTFENGQLIVTSTAAKENNFTRVMPDANKNALAGAAMVWDSLKDKSQLQSFADVLADPTSDYKKLINELIGKYDNGDYTDMERALTSVSGSSIATIAPAFMQDLHRQIKAIRNRTTTMAADATYEAYDTLPLWHAWINGEGGYHKLDSDGYMPGYTLNNWGGTVGVDVDVTPSATMGLAISAMYGDLKPNSADAATGHMDTTWLSAFLRANSGAWIHTFVVSGGLADINLDRTVNYGSGSYRANGSTDGYAVGAMYEVGYTQLMNESGTFVLQPVFNVEVRHASVKGYTESGTDAGLKVDDIKQDLVTFGAGARLQSVVDTNAFNRTAIFEARALLKADVGDRSGKAKNSIIGSDSMSEVESAEVGALGVEIGAGITIPLGSESGSIFVDASLEYRRGWTSADASVGYRINF